MHRHVLSSAFIVLCAAASPASAFDCAKAKSAVELAICANADLMESDLALERVYQALRATLSPADRNALAASERRWVFQRDALCGFETGVKQTTCIAREQEERKHLLSGKALTGPGPGSRMAPVFLAQAPAADRYEVDYMLMKFVSPATPGEIAFNREVERILVSAPMGATSNAAPEGGFLSSSVLMSLSYASPAFISAKTVFYSFEGGAHPNGGTSNINIDLGTGQSLAPTEIFDKDGQDRLFEDCKRQIVAQKSRNTQGQAYNIAEDSSYSDEAVRQAIFDIARWGFGQSTTTITFDPYAIGAYAEGPYVCEFATRKLREMASGKFPIE
jgi:uncharacterized protein YecT (DUF1311 family)